MVKQIYSVFDAKAQTYSHPFYAPNEQIAIRDFTRACRDPQLDLSKFPEDFSLQHLGTFDDENAQFSVNLNPVPVITALACKE